MGVFLVVNLDFNFGKFDCFDSELNMIIWFKRWVGDWFLLVYLFRVLRSLIGVLLL